MSVEKLLDEMENMLLDSARVPLTNKRVIEEDEIAGFIDEIRDTIPKEVFEAKQIVNERQRILEEAQKEAQNIVEQAKKYVVKLTDEHLITKQAQEQAGELISEAQKSAHELKSDAVNYASDVFNHLIMNMEKTLEAVRQSQKVLMHAQNNSMKE